MPETKKRGKIVIAEDDKYISIAYKDGLGRAGFEVITALDGQSAIDQIKSQAPDLVLLDLIMPVKNGFEVLTEISADKILKKIPVIILSNLGQNTDISKGKELGAVDYLIKSDFSMKDVIEKIESHLKK